MRRRTRIEWARVGRLAVPLVLALLGVVGLALAARGGPSPPNAAYVGLHNSNDTLAVADLLSQTVVVTTPLTTQGDYPYDATLTSDGSEVWLVGNSGNGVVIVDTASNTVVMTITDPSLIDTPVDVLFSEHGGIAYISSREDAIAAITMIDTSTYQIIGVINVPALFLGPGNMAIDNCLGTLYVVNWFDDHLFVIDPVTLTTVDDIQFGDSLWDPVMSPDAKTVYITDRDSGNDQVHFFDTTAMTVTQSVPVGDDPWAIDVTPDGRLLFVALEDDQAVQVIDVDQAVVTKTIPLDVDADPRDVDISVDGKFAYVVSGDIAGDDKVYVIDTTTLTWVDTIPIRNIPNTTNNPNVLAVAPQPASLDPVAAFTSNSPVDHGMITAFADTSSNSPTSWLWDFGDGVGTSTLQNPQYMYANPGTYNVTLTASSPCGADTFMAQVVVDPVSATIYSPILFRK